MSEDPTEPPEVPNRTASRYVALGVSMGFGAAFAITGLSMAHHGPQEPLLEALVMLVSLGGGAHFFTRFLDT